MAVSITIKKLTLSAAGSVARLKDIIWRPLWRLLTFSLADDKISPKKGLSVSLEMGTLSVAYGSRFLSRIKIKGFREYSFEEGRYPQAESLASSTALAINDLGGGGADVSLSIPKAWAIIKTVEFPVTVKENLSDVVSYELDRLTPFSSEDAFYDFKILKEDTQNLTLLVMAVKADLVKPYVEALRGRGINVSRVTVNLSCIETLCRYMDKRMDSIFVEIKEDGYEGALFLDGAITGAFTGSFTTGDEKSKVDTFMAGINPLVTAAQKHSKSPKIMILLKDKSPTLKELLKLQINLPVTFLNETDIKIRLSGSYDYKAIPYAAIGGVLESLWPKAMGLNLLQRGRQEKPKSPKAFTIILILSIITMSILYMIAPLRIEGERLKEIDRQIMLRKEDVRKVEALKKEVEALNKEIYTVNNFKENRPMALAILKDLTVILPKNVWLSRLRITGETVSIEGYAASATGLLPKLEASKYFSKAEFASPTIRDTRMNADRFNIKMEIEGVRKDEGEGLKKRESVLEDEGE